MMLTSNARVLLIIEKEKEKEVHHQSNAFRYGLMSTPRRDN